MGIFVSGDTAYWDVPGAVIRGEVLIFSDDAVVIVAKAAVDPVTGEDIRAISTFTRTFLHDEVRKTVSGKSTMAG